MNRRVELRQIAFLQEVLVPQPFILSAKWPGILVRRAFDVKICVEKRYGAPKG
jgi:hypothetical protein